MSRPKVKDVARPLGEGKGNHRRGGQANRSTTYPRTVNDSFY